MPWSDELLFLFLSGLLVGERKTSKWRSPTETVALKAGETSIQSFGQREDISLTGQVKALLCLKTYIIHRHQSHFANLGTEGGVSSAFVHWLIESTFIDMKIMPKADKGLPRDPEHKGMV